MDNSFKNEVIIIGGNHFMYGSQASYEDLNKEYKKVLGEYDCLGSGNLIVFANRDDYSCQKTEDDFGDDNSIQYKIFFFRDIFHKVISLIL